MDLNHIAVFVAVAEQESFTGAAATLGLPKSSVSRTITKLEEELGVRLLERTTRKLSLTDAGARYYARSRLALSDLGDATAEVGDLGTEPRGIVRLTAPNDVGVLALSDLLAEFTRLYPNIHVELTLTSRVVDLVGEGIDLAIRGGTLPDSTLIARKLFDSELALYAASGYLERRGTPENLLALARHDCVLFRAKNARITWHLTGPLGVESVEVSGRVGADDLLFVQRAVESGIGIGLVPIALAQKCPSSRSLVRVLPEYSVPGPAAYVVAPPGRYQPARVTLLRDFLVERLADRCTNPKH